MLIREILEGADDVDYGLDASYRVFFAVGSKEVKHSVHGVIDVGPHGLS